MTYMNLLLTASEPAEPSLLSSNGSPVWPIRDEADFLALARLAKLFGARVRRADAVVDSMLPPPDAAAGAVLALSPVVEEHARLYAFLTGRRYAGVIARPAVCDVDVVVGYWADVNDRLIYELYRGATRAVGLVVGATDGDLRRAVLLCAAAATLTPERVLSPVTFWPQLGEGRRQEGDASSAVTSKLHQAASFLVTIAHSDGIDASFGDMVLCTTDRRRALPSAGRPSCVDTGFCHRLHKDIDEAHETGRLIYPDALQARVVLLGICWGVMLQPSIVAPQWSIADRLLQSPQVGAILAPWKPVFIEPADLQPAADALASGETAGSALLKHNQGESSRVRGAELCLLGDPRVLATQKVPAVPFSIDSAWGHGRVKDIDLANVAFLRTIVKSMVVPDNLQSCRGALAALNEVEEQAWLSDSREPAWTALRSQRVISALSTYKTKLYQVSLQFATAFNYLGTESCWICGIAAEIVRLKYRAQVFHRALLVCPRCGISQDRPENSIHTPIYFNIDAKQRITLTRPLKAPCSAAVIVGHRLPTEKIRLMWPQVGDGIELSFTLPFSLPRSLIYLTVAILEEGRLTLSRRPIRLEEANELA